MEIFLKPLECSIPIAETGIDVRYIPPNGFAPGVPCFEFLHYGQRLEDVKYLYAWKVARECNEEPYFLELKAEFVNMDGETYKCNLYDWYKDFTNPPLIGPFDLDALDVFINWRRYMEPATNVGPDDNELLYDRVIYFGPYFNEQ